MNQLGKAPNHALPAATRAVLTAPVPFQLKTSLATGLIADYNNAPQTALPDFGPTFAKASAHATPAEREALDHLHTRLDSIVQTAATGAFKLPLRYGAIFALLVLPLLAWARIRSRATQPAETPARGNGR